MFIKVFKLLGLIGLGALVGCGTLKERCPEDPFDPNASGFCRLMYTEEDRKNRLATESEQGDQLEQQGEQLKEEEGLSITEFKKARAAAAELRGELTAQEARAAEMEARVKELEASGERSLDELHSINIRLGKVQELLKNADDTRGSSPEDVGKLQLLKIELEKELDALLDM